MRRTALLVVLALAFVALVNPLAALQRSFLYFPLAQEPPPVAGVLPGAEEVAFTTADDLRLRGWFQAGTASAPTVIVFNGNAGDRSHRAPLAAALAREGFGVLLFDYRGYGGNPGTPSEEGLLADARAAADFVRTRVGTDRIAYFGESLGAAVAVALAAERPPAALVLRSPFTSLADMARLHYPWLPVGPLLAERYDSIGTIARVPAPTLVIAGTRDRIVPLEQSRRLYDAASAPKAFVEIAGADHNDLDLLAGDEMIGAVASFLRDR